MPFLLAQNDTGRGERIELHGLRITFGRAHENDHFFPEDPKLSRKHFALVRRPDGWAVRDLGSSNGTWVNSEKVEREHVLRNGDRLQAGGLAFVYEGEPTEPVASGRVQFVQDTVKGPVSVHTTSTYLHDLLGGERTGEEQPQDILSHPAFQALIKAGGELSEQRPLGEMFQRILDLSIEAVGAERGVLLAYEDGELLEKAAHGDAFQISTTVRDKVVDSRESLLIRDAALDEAMAAARSIDLSATRSLLAVPLQTDATVLGLLYLDTSSLLRPFTEQDLELATVLGHIAANRIEQKRLALVERAQEALERDLDRASSIQAALLPTAPPQVPGLELSGHSTPCRTVGGDLYGWRNPREGRAGLMIADVSGKGIPAALIMTGLHAGLQVLIDHIRDPAEILHHINNYLCENTPDNAFVTLVLCILDVVEGKLYWANAGHNPPILARADGSTEQLKATGPVLGILGNIRHEMQATDFGAGDFAVLYSDGVTEARSTDDEEYGEERLDAVLEGCRGQDADAVRDAIVQSVQEWQTGTEPHDDVTVVVARRTS